MVVMYWIDSKDYATASGRRGYSVRSKFIIIFQVNFFLQLGYRIDTPPPELDIESLPTGNIEKVPLKPQLSRTKSKDGDDSKIAMRRKLFAVRRESTIGTMVMADKLDDNDIRRKFRNYEI